MITFMLVIAVVFLFGVFALLAAFRSISMKEDEFEEDEEEDGF